MKQEISNPIIIYTEDDEAGTNIARKLISEGIIVHKIIGELITAEDIDETLRREGKDHDFIIFLSKHSSKEQRKTLTVHTIGNWKEAKYGGIEGRASPAQAIIMKEAMMILKERAIKNNADDYEVTMECTHHGPLINTPSLFIETGGSRVEWNDDKAITVLAETVQELLRRIHKKMINYDKKSTIAIGGLHYCQSFNKIQTNNEEYAIGHVIPKYSLPINNKIIMEAINKTIPKPKIAIIDYKGLGIAEVRDETIKLLKEEKLIVMKTSEMKK